MFCLIVSMRAHTIVFWVCLSAAIGLMIAGFFAPPTGVIDGSVLTAVGFLFLFATLGELPTIIKGRRVELKRGDTNIILGDDD